MNALVDKVVTGIYRSNDKQYLKFELRDGDPIYAECYGDCCSHTWIEHLELPALELPARVISVDNLDMNKPGEEHEGDWDTGYIQFYGYKIVTDRGEIIIDYRNESSGYYGGSLDWADDFTRYHPDASIEWEKAA